MNYTRQPDPPAALPVREKIPNAEAIAIARELLRPVMHLLAKDGYGKRSAMLTGSIRRGCPMVGDIDTVLLPAGPIQKAEIQRYLWTVAKKTLCRGAVKQSGLYSDGAGALVQMDVWYARDRDSDGETDLFAAALPSNWGTIVLYSTGSKEHNVRIAAAAQARGWHWHQFAGLQIPSGNGEPDQVISQTEELIYSALDLPFIQPGLRS